MRRALWLAAAAVLLASLVLAAMPDAAADAPDVYLPIAGKVIFPTATPTVTPTRTATPVPTATSTTGPPGPGVLYGHLTFNGVPAVGQTLQITECSPDGCIPPGRQATTDSSGQYSFEVGALRKGGWYYVNWFGALIPTNQRSQYVGSYQTRDVPEFAAGSVIYVGTGEIRDFPYIEPDRGVVLSLPATFRWEKQGFSGERWQWHLYVNGDKPASFYSSGLDSPEFTLTCLPQGFRSGSQYFWRALARDGWGGFAVPYTGGRAVTFRNASAC